MKALLDIKTAANLLSLSSWTIRVYIRQGKLRPVRIGRLVRLEEEELQRFVAEAKATGETEAKHIGEVSPLKEQTEQ